MLAIGKDLVLQRQERATRIDQVNARQVILFCNLLRTKVLLDGQRVIGAAFDGRIIGDNHAVDVVNLADARNDARGRHFIVIKAIRRKLPDFQKRRATVDDRANSIARQQFSP